MQPFPFLCRASLHDIFDSYKIGLFRNNLDPLQGTDVTIFAEEVKERLRSIDVTSSSGKRHGLNDADFSLEDNLIMFQGVFPGVGENLYSEVRLVSEVVVNLAKEKDVNLIMSIKLDALHLGRQIYLWETSAYVDHKTSFSELFLGEEENDEGDYELVHNDEPVSLDLKAEWQTDELSDGFEESPYEEDEGLSDKLYNVAYSFFLSNN